MIETTGRKMAFALVVLIMGVAVDIFGPHGLSNALAGLMATLVTVFCVSNVVAGAQGAKVEAAKVAASAASSLTNDTQIATKLHEVHELVTTVGQAVSTTNKVLTAALGAANKPGA